MTKTMATNLQIKSLIFNTLLNAQGMGYKTLDQDMVVQTVSDKMDDMDLIYEKSNIYQMIKKMCEMDVLYRVTSSTGVNVGLTR